MMFALSLLSTRAGEIFQIFKADPLLYIPLVLWWFIFERYYIFHSSDEIREVDVLDNGLSALYTGFYISPFVQGISAAAFIHPSPKTLLSFAFLGWGIFLMLAAFIKILPQFIITFLGGSSIDLAVTLLAIFFVDKLIPIDTATIVIILAPILTIKLLALVRKLFS